MTNQQGAPEAPKNSIADYEAGWKDGYKQGAWAAQQPAPSAAPAVSDEDEALDLLAALFDAWENGTPCYEEPESSDGFLGHAFSLDDEVFHRCADLLNRRRGKQPSPTAQADSQPAPSTDQVEEILRERDDAEDFIDVLLDEVLGHERPEWSSAYGRADALNDVQERMTALHKPAVDKAWDQFQSAMAADSVLEDAARYRHIRDVPHSEEVRSVLIHQQNAVMDKVIDKDRAAMAAKKGETHE